MSLGGLANQVVLPRSTRPPLTDSTRPGHRTRLRSVMTRAFPACRRGPGASPCWVIPTVALSRALASWEGSGCIAGERAFSLTTYAAGSLAAASLVALPGCDPRCAEHAPIAAHEWPSARTPHRRSHLLLVCRRVTALAMSRIARIQAVIVRPAPSNQRASSSA
jgi:hypothetical protein